MRNMKVINSHAGNLIVDTLPSTLKSGDALHASPCVFESLLQSAERDLDRLHDEVHTLRVQRRYLVIVIVALSIVAVKFFLALLP